MGHMPQIQAPLFTWRALSSSAYIRNSWEDVSPDFIAYNDSMVVVDQYKMVHFNAFHATHNTSHIAISLLKEIVMVHGVPRSKVSDWIQSF